MDYILIKVLINLNNRISLEKISIFAFEKILISYLKISSFVLEKKFNLTFKKFQFNKKVILWIM